MFDKTFELFDRTMQMLDREMKCLFMRPTKSNTRVRVKIKAGSKVYVNGVMVELVNDAIVLTSELDRLMNTKK